MNDERHLPPRTLREYRHDQLAAAEMLDASDHLAACSSCRETLATLDDGPRYEELAAALDGSLDPAARAAFARRLAEAPRAAAEFADLEAFQREMSAGSPRVYGPTAAGDQIPAPGVEPDKILTPVPGTWWRRHEAFIQSVAAIAAVLLLTTVWWRVSGSKTALEDTLLTDARGRRANLALLPEDLRDAVARTLREGRVPAAVLPPEVRPRGGALAGPTAATRTPFLAVQPVGVIVRGRQPTLRWTPRADATGYVVVLDPLLGGEAPATTLVSPELPATQTEWTPSEPLAAGAVYAWQVEARRGGGETLDRAPRPPAAEARFQVLDDARRAELDRIERQFADFPLVAAVALARAGLTEAVAGQLDKLAREHPQSAAAQRLQRGAAASAAAAAGGGSGWER